MKNEFFAHVEAMNQIMSNLVSIDEKNHTIVIDYEVFDKAAESEADFDSFDRLLNDADALRPVWSINVIHANMYAML